MSSSNPQVVIVGAGPAGIRAAQALVQAGLRPTVIDEGARAGGQIYRRPPMNFNRSPQTLYGSEAGKARALHSTFDALIAADRISYHSNTSVVAIADRRLHVLGGSASTTVAYDRLILATGASDRVAPIPGWQAPGVYTLGAAQIALKAQGVALGRRIVLAGSGPLLTLVAAQLRAAGAGVVAVLDTAPLGVQLRGLAGLSARPMVMLRGLAMRARLGRLYHAGASVTRIDADETGVGAVCWRDASDSEHHIECDMVGIGWHLRAETHLADLAGCTFAYDEQWAQWLPRIDAMGRAAEGVYLAGDGVRLLGADGAEVAGRVAAAACLRDLGMQAADTAADLRRLARLERFARGIARAFPWPVAMLRSLPDATIVCRCEDVTAGELRQTVDYGGAEANRVKSLGRVGMGRCQGRFCQLAGAELIAAAAGCSAGEAGRLRGQAPVRPAPIAAYLLDD